ncbi:rhamnan synthesis F family protein [Agrobacterium tumefaciens]|uniref:rhamnan synthesis F family protein n=1 Tax=Agrobacterium tumefaciens TaxID=358 RepID=UPI003459ED09
MFYDKEGFVSPHMMRSLRAFKPFLDEILFVSNGEVDGESYQQVADVITYKLVRQNVGFDVWGYKEGLEYIGYDNLELYDEIVFLNYTFFAPFNDIGAMFDAMAAKSLDFWGMTAYQDLAKDFLQSYFIVSRKSLHATTDFRLYWQEMPVIRSINDSLEYHEFRFSNHFRRLGYRGAPFMENEPGWTGNTTLVDVKAQLDKGLPLIKYRAFNFDSNILERRGGRRPAENFNVVAEHTNYPVDEIWDYIISQSSVDQLIINAELMSFTETRPMTPRKSSKNVKSDSDPILVASLSDIQTLESAFKRMECFAARRVFVVTDDTTITSKARDLGYNVQTSSPLGTALDIWFDEIAKIVQADTPVFMVSDFPRERPRYFFKDILFEEYWDTLIASDGTVAQVATWLKGNPHIGIGFPSTSSVDGRENHHKGVDSSAANWTFKEYPAYAKGAVSQKYWPWMGICVLRGELFSRQRLRSRIREISSKFRPRDREPFAGVEGVLPELVRLERFAPALIVSKDSIPKLILRAHLLEVQNEATILQLVRKFRMEQKNNLNGEVPSVVEKDPQIKVPAVAKVKEDLVAREPQSAIHNVSKNILKLKINAIERDIVVTPFAEGHIDEVQLEADKVYLRGWAFDGKTPSKTLSVGVLHNGQLLGAFVPFTGIREDVFHAYASRKVPRLCGFSTNASVLHLDELNPDHFSVAILEETKLSVWVAPLKEGPIREAKPVNSEMRRMFSWR